MPLCENCSFKETGLQTMMNGQKWCAECAVQVYNISYNFSNPNRHHDWEAWIRRRKRKIKRELRYKLLKVGQLRDKCRKYNLTSEGTKQQMMKRLVKRT